MSCMATNLWIPHAPGLLPDLSRQLQLPAARCTLLHLPCRQQLVRHPVPQSVVAVAVGNPSHPPTHPLQATAATSCSATSLYRPTWCTPWGPTAAPSCRCLRAPTCASAPWKCTGEPAAVNLCVRAQVGLRCRCGQQTRTCAQRKCTGEQAAEVATPVPFLTQLPVGHGAVHRCLIGHPVLH